MQASAKKYALIGLSAFFALSAGFFTYNRLTDQGPGMSNERDSRALLSTDLLDVDGEQHSLRQWNGQILVVNFWATWCAPCREEIPELIKLQEEFSQKGAQVIGIAIDQTEPVRAYAREMNINYPILLAEAQGIALSQKLGNQKGALPFTVILDENGKLIHRKLGKVSYSELRPLVLNLL